jgi:hypothetical protein
VIDAKLAAVLDAPVEVSVIVLLSITSPTTPAGAALASVTPSSFMTDVMTIGLVVGLFPRLL